MVLSPQLVSVHSMAAEPARPWMRRHGGAVTVSLPPRCFAMLRVGRLQRGRKIFFCLPSTCPSARVARLGTVPGCFQSRWRRWYIAFSSNAILGPGAPFRITSCPVILRATDDSLPGGADNSEMTSTQIHENARWLCGQVGCRWTCGGRDRQSGRSGECVE
jgi:hypothetical protein